MEHLLAPSILAADFANLERDIQLINASEADWFHLDVMDGVFVPNISFGMPVIKSIATHATKPLDVHTVHAEACTHLHRTLAQIRSLGMKAGVALNPHTPVSTLTDVLGDLDLVCLMSVNPGFGGQKFIERTYEKTTVLRSMLTAAGSNAHIEIDGGVGPGNWKALVEAGADVLVAGSSTFNAADPHAAILEMKGQ